MMPRAIVFCRGIAVSLLLTSLCDCAAVGGMYIGNADRDLHDQVRLLVRENGHPGAGHNAVIGKISKNMAPVDGAAESTKSTSVGVSRLNYDGVDDAKICFSNVYSGDPDWNPPDIGQGLLTWRWAVAGYRSFGDFAGPGAPWPVPATSAFSSVHVVKNVVVKRVYEGVETKRRDITVQVCGAAPAISPDANWLAVMKMNSTGALADARGETNEIFLWAITDAETFDTGYKGGVLEGFDFPASAPAGAAPASTTH